MSVRSGLVPLVSSFLGMVLAAGAASAAPSASMEQVRNGVASATTTPASTWGTGNAGASNSHYLESHSIAYRSVLDDLPTDGTVVELVIGYNVKRSGSYAIDYLTHYQRLLPHVLFGHRDPEVFDPLSGVSGVAAGFTTAPIPAVTRNLLVDPDGTGPDPAMLQPVTNQAALSAGDRLMTLFGGTLLDVTYVSEGDVALATGSSETQVKVRFVPGGPRAVLAWGGHIACRWDWGFNANGTPRSAGGINGSSYHMRLVGWNLGSLGNMDRSMSTDAVFPVPRCGVSNAGPFCAGSTNTHTAPEGMESYAWTLFDDTAGSVIVGAADGTSVTVRTSQPGSYSLRVTTGASGFTRECAATVTVNAPVTADAGADLVACAASPQVALAAIAGGGSGAWVGGAGAFSPGRAAANALYTPTAAEIAAGGVTLTFTVTPLSGPCPPASDAVRITVRPVATANAGTDLAVCASAPQVTLAGAVGGGATSGTWSGGAGSYSPNASSLTATYTPTAGEIAAGGVTLTLTSNDPAGPCGTFADQVRITINPAATVDAGADRIACASAPAVQLAGVVGGGASGGTWSGGAGSFSPRNTALNATYAPTAGEIAAGGVTLTLTSNDPTGPCPPVFDTVRITIDPVTVALAGADQTVCASSPSVVLQGQVTGTVTNGAWTGGTGTFTPSRQALNATYLPSSAEIAAGSVTLTLTSAASSRPCPPDDDAVTIFISPVATVNAGPDQVACAATPQVTLAGSAGGAASGASWVGGAGTFTPGRSALNATYVPSPGEIAARGVTLTLTTNDPAGPCPPVSDQVRITYDAPTVSVPDRIVCSGVVPATLCANPANGIAPYTYLWSNGATTQCIAVSDTGRYTVAITDARGCQASGGGSYRLRDCQGLIAHTSATCDTYQAGTAAGMPSSDVHWAVQDGLISNVAPGVFFYWTKISAPRASFTVQIAQAKSHPAAWFIELAQGQVSLFDADCNSLPGGVETGPGQAAVNITGATPGRVYIIAVKYSLKSLVGMPLDPANGVRYDFRTVIDGVIVDADPDGLVIGTMGMVGVGEPFEPGEGVELYRPFPNPFSNGMRMAYLVSDPRQEVHITVYDLAGRRVRTLAAGPQPAGRHLATWDGRDEDGTAIRSGMYFVRARIGAEMRKVQVVFVR
jgi:hypothetical protein